MTYYMQCSHLRLVLAACLGIHVFGYRVHRHKDAHNKSWHLEHRAGNLANVSSNLHKDAHNKSFHLEHKAGNMANTSSNVTVHEGAAKGQENLEKKGAEGPENKGAEGERPLPPYHMKENTGLQEQGFKGKDVEHNDMKTMAADWRKEYGPGHANYKTMAEICKEYPKNPSCADYLPTEAPVKAPAAQPVPGVLKSMAEGSAVSLLVCTSLLVMRAM